MHKIGYVFLWMLTVCFSAGVAAQQATRHVYAVKGKDTLWLDHYQPAIPPNGSSILFVHGGAFTGGNPESQKPLAEGMTKLGYHVFVIKYRLYLKGKSFGCETATPAKLTAIQQAVEDVQDATAWLAGQVNRLNVDSSRLFIAGSSAGAEAILNLVYNPFITRKDAVKPGSRFPYAGALSFSGAVLDINTLKRPAIPLLLMHGTNDQLVPYGTSAHRFCKASDAGWLMMFGAHTIYETLQKENKPVILYTYEGRGHEVSNYMFRCFKEMDDFMKGVIQGTMLLPSEIKIQGLDQSL